MEMKQAQRDLYKAALAAFKNQEHLMSADKALQHEDWVVGVTASAPAEVETFFYELKTTAEKKVSVAELGSCCSLPEADQESA